MVFIPFENLWQLLLALGKCMHSANKTTAPPSLNLTTLSNSASITTPVTMAHTVNSTISSLVKSISSNSTISSLVKSIPSNSTNISTPCPTNTGLSVVNSPSKEFWERYVLQITDTINDFGEFRSELILCLIIAWVLVYLCLFKGIKSSGKVN